MAFAARQTPAGWQLCLRKGATVPNHVFASQAKAKACADALNAAHWADWTKGHPKSEDDPVLASMHEIVRSHQ